MANVDKGTGKSMGRSFMGSGNSSPTQFNTPSSFDGRSGSTVNLGPVVGGGLGVSNNLAGKAVKGMPPIPKGAILG
jgi:hypothetical protein